MKAGFIPPDHTSDHHFQNISTMDSPNVLLHSYASCPRQLLGDVVFFLLFLRLCSLCPSSEIRSILFPLPRIKSRGSLCLKRLADLSAPPLQNALLRIISIAFTWPTKCQYHVELFFSKYLLEFCKHPCEGLGALFLCIVLIGYPLHWWSEMTFCHRLQLSAWTKLSMLRLLQPNVDPSD